MTGVLLIVFVILGFIITAQTLLESVQVVSTSQLQADKTREAKRREVHHAASVQRLQHHWRL